MWDEPSQHTQHKYATNFSFVASHGSELSDHIRKLDRHSHLLLEGPYGGNSNLHNFETVFLVAKGTGIIGLLPLAISLAERRQHDDDLRKASQNFPKMENQLTQMEEDWRNRERELAQDEQEMIKKEQNLLRNGKRLRRRVGNAKTLEDALEREAKTLQKERRRMDQEGEDIRTAKLRFQQHKDKTMSGMFFSDATRKVDLFWQLDHNDQGLWAWKYLKILQDLDPENVCRLSSLLWNDV